MKTFYVVGLWLSVSVGLLAPKAWAKVPNSDGIEPAPVPNGQLALVESHDGFYLPPPAPRYPYYGGYYGGPRLSELPKDIEPMTSAQLIERWQAADKQNSDTYRRGQWPLKPNEMANPMAIGGECVTRKGDQVSEKFAAILHFVNYPGTMHGGFVFIPHKQDADGKPVPSDFFRKRNFKYSRLSAEINEETMKLGQLQASQAGIQAQIKPPAELWDPRVMDINKKILAATGEMDALFPFKDDMAQKQSAILEGQVAELTKKKEILLKGNDPTDSTGLDALKKRISGIQDHIEQLMGDRDDTVDQELEENRGIFVEQKRDRSGLARYRLRPELKLLEYGLEVNIGNPRARVFQSADNSVRAELQYVKDPNSKAPNARQIITRIVDADGTETFCY